jgi:putative spermidine/putrescine transport system permease protein
VFASATREFYRWGLAGTIAGVVLVHLVGGLVFAVWTMTAVFRAIAPELEEAAHNLGASVTRGFLTVSLPLAVPGSWRAPCSCSSTRSTSSPARCWSARRS